LVKRLICGGFCLGPVAAAVAGGVASGSAGAVANHALNRWTWNPFG
jgi:hypothetical protein